MAFGRGCRRPVLPLPSIPLIAVLPVANLSSDPRQDYFNDGITDDLVTDDGIFRERRDAPSRAAGNGLPLEAH
jgi:TolB-like protein